MNKKPLIFFLITFLFSPLVYAQVYSDNHNPMIGTRQINELKTQLGEDKMQLADFRNGINELQSVIITKDTNKVVQLKGELLSKMRLEIQRNEQELKMERRMRTQYTQLEEPNIKYPKVNTPEERRLEMERRRNEQKEINKVQEPEDVHSRNSNLDNPEKRRTVNQGKENRQIPLNEAPDPKNIRDRNSSLDTPREGMRNKRYLHDKRNEMHRPIGEAEPPVAYTKMPEPSAPKKNLGGRNNSVDTALIRRDRMLQKQHNIDAIHKRIDRISKQKRILEAFRAYNFGCTAETLVRDNKNMGLLNEFADSMEEHIATAKRELTEKETKLREERNNPNERRLEYNK